MASAQWGEQQQQTNLMMARSNQYKPSVWMLGCQQAHVHSVDTPIASAPGSHCTVQFHRPVALPKQCIADAGPGHCTANGGCCWGVGGGVQGPLILSSMLLLTTGLLSSLMSCGGPSGRLTAWQGFAFDPRISCLHTDCIMEYPSWHACGMQRVLYRCSCCFQPAMPLRLGKSCSTQRVAAGRGRLLAI